MEFKIGKLSSETGINVDTIRYYEKQGLIQPIQRKQSGYRIYNDNSIKEMEFIKCAQNLGFNLHEIKELLAIDMDSDKDNIEAVRKVLRKKAEELKKLLSDTARITKALNIIDANCCDSHVNNFMDLMFSDEVQDIAKHSELKNTYLLEEGSWAVDGMAVTEDGSKVDVVGLVTVIHEVNIWTMRNDFVIGDGIKSPVILHVPPIKNSMEVSRYVGNCCLYGDVDGVITVTGDSIFKCYRMPEFNYKGFEHMKKLSAQVYDVNGLVINKERAILKWEYKMERVETAVPTS